MSTSRPPSQPHAAGEAGVSASWLQCVLAAAVLLMAGASLAFAAMAAATRCDAEAHERP